MLTNNVFGSVRVPEIQEGDNTGSVELVGRLGSLKLAVFQNPSGGAFLFPTVDPTTVAPIPEPGTVLLFGSGLFVAVSKALGRRKGSA